MRQARLQRIGRDPLDRLRRLRGDVRPDESKVAMAAKRFQQSADGQILIEWLIAHSYGRTIQPSAPDSALRENEARKRFLDQFLALAEEPSEVSDASTNEKS